FSSMLLPPPTSTLFPYTTLFRSHRCRELDVVERERDVEAVVGPELSLAHGRIPREVVHVHRRAALRGLALRLGRDADAKGIVGGDRKSTRLNSSHVKISYAVFCL